MSLRFPLQMWTLHTTGAPAQEIQTLKPEPNNPLNVFSITLLSTRSILTKISVLFRSETNHQTAGKSEHIYFHDHCQYVRPSPMLPVLRTNSRGSIIS